MANRTGHREFGPATSSVGILSRPAKVGEGDAITRKNSGNSNIYGRIQCKEKSPCPTAHRAKNRLQSNLPTVYNPNTIHRRMCTVCNRWKFLILRNVMSVARIARFCFFSTHPCDILPPGGSDDRELRDLRMGALRPCRTPFPFFLSPGTWVHNRRSAAHILYDSASDPDNTAVFPGDQADFFMKPQMERRGSRTGGDPQN